MSLAAYRVLPSAQNGHTQEDSPPRRTDTSSEDCTENDERLSSLSLSDEKPFPDCADIPHTWSAASDHAPGAERGHGDLRFNPQGPQTQKLLKSYNSALYNRFVTNQKIFYNGQPLTDISKLPSTFMEPRMMPASVRPYIPTFPNYVSQDNAINRREVHVPIAHMKMENTKFGPGWESKVPAARIEPRTIDLLALRLASMSVGGDNLRDAKLQESSYPTENGWNGESHEAQNGFHGKLQQRPTRNGRKDGTPQPPASIPNHTMLLDEVYSRKVFIGGLPPDIDEEEIHRVFSRYGSLLVDWPHKTETNTYFPPKGYAFLLYHDEFSVCRLMDSCICDGDKNYMILSSPSVRNKSVQVRPWCLKDAECLLVDGYRLDCRMTVFVGGVPRPLKAAELAMIMNGIYGNVCYASIDIDADLKYPKGAGKVCFDNIKSYIAAISSRFVHIKMKDLDKRVEVKPYIMDDMVCDLCAGSACNFKSAPLFCANVNCLTYFCEVCWHHHHHVGSGLEGHRPSVKEHGGERGRQGSGSSYRW